MMIIMIRGTSGSGKTWAMRSAMSDLEIDCPEPEKGMVEGRKKPLWYRYGTVFILGHYEATCGGCDNVGSARKVYELWQKLMEKFDSPIIICEGLLLSEDAKWTKEAKDNGWDPRVIYLNTDVEHCITQIKERRKAAGNDKPLNEKNTRHRVNVIKRSRVRLEEMGVPCRGASSGQVSGIVRRWIDGDRT